MNREFILQETNDGYSLCLDGVQFEKIQEDNQKQKFENKRRKRVKNYNNMKLQNSYESFSNPLRHIESGQIRDLSILEEEDSDSLSKRLYIAKKI